MRSKRCCMRGGEKKMPNHDQHASPEELLLYSEGVLTGKAADIVANHLDDCEECYLTVVLHHELQELDSLGVLPTGTPAGIPQQSEPKASARECSKGPGIFGAVGGLLAGIGLTGSLTHHPIPSLGENFDDHDHHDVR